MRYSSHDKMPVPTLVVTAIQHVFSLCIFLVFPILVGKAANVPAQSIPGLLSVALVALGVANLLQAVQRVGTRYLCPAGMTAAYLGPSLIAAKLGGLSLVFGMTLFAGLVESVLSQFLSRLRIFMPPTILGVVVIMVGIANAMTGFRTLFGSGMMPHDLLAAGIAMVTMILAYLAPIAHVRLFCALLGIIAGYAVSFMTGGIDVATWGGLPDLPLLALPAISTAGWSFDITLLVPFAVVAVSAAVKQSGFIVAAIEADGGANPAETGSALRRGVLADALGTIAGGLMGGLGVNVSASSQGIITATGVGARRVGYAIAAILILLGCQPHFSAILALMPRGVIAAVLVFTSIFVLSNGLHTVVSAGLDREKGLCVGLAILGGLAADAVPQIAAAMPADLKPFAVSSFIAGTTIAIVVNAIFAISRLRLAVPNRVRLDAQ